MRDPQFDSIACLIGNVARNTMAGCFDFVIQPFINIQTQACVGGEVLIRGRCKGKTVNPGCFIPTLEHNKTIPLLDIFVFTEGVAFARQHRLLSQGTFRLSFNFSPGEFNQQGFSSNLIQRVSDSEAKHIILEITEAEVAINAAGLRHIQQLQEYGFTVTWDDICGLQTAQQKQRQIPCPLLKLDRSMIRAENQHKTQQLIAYCQQQQLELIIEGVETEAQLQWLIEQDVTLVQGYYFSPPIDKHHFVHRYFPNGTSL